MIDARLIKFLNTKMGQHPACKMPLADFVEQFQGYVGRRGKDEFPRGTIVAQLGEAGVQIAVDQRVQQLLGVAPRNAEWQSVRGKLVLTDHYARDTRKSQRERAYAR